MGAPAKALKEAHEEAEDEEGVHLYRPAVLPLEESKDVKSANGAARATRARANKCGKPATVPERGRLQSASGR